METQTDTKKKRGLKITLIILGVVAALILAAVLYGVSLWRRARQNMVPTVEKPQQEIAVQETIAPPAPTADPFTEALRPDIDYYETGEIVEVPIYEQTKIDKYTITLLIVVQQGKVDSEPRQTDMIFLTSFNQLRQKFSIVAFPRDMLLPTHEYGWKRLGAIYATGGVGMLINTLNDCFDLSIQDYVYTGTEELAKLADAVEGVPATLTEAEAAYINEQTGSNVSAGFNRLSGMQAICFLSDRISDDKGDMGRAERQLDMINDTFRYLTDNFDRSYLFPLFTVIYKCLRTNSDWETISGLGSELAVSNDLVVATIRMPYDDAYSELMLDGAYSILPEIEKNKILLRQALFGKK